MRTLQAAPFRGGPDRPGGRFHVPSGNWTSATLRPDGADPAEAQLPARHGDASADRELLGVEEGSVREARVVADADVGEVDRGRKDLEVHAPEAAPAAAGAPTGAAAETPWKSDWKRSEFQIA